MDLVPPSKEPTPAELKYGAGWKILIPFAILPLVVVSASVGVFLLFGWLANRESSPEDYLRELRSGSNHRKWQAAYELSRFLARGDVGANRAQFEAEMLRLLAQTSKEEVDLRRYLMIGLAQIGSGASHQPLIHWVQTSSDSETKIYALWALGRLAAKEALPVIEKETHSDDAGIRKTAAFSLGFVGSSKEIRRLKELLSDPIEDVRWNAALGLAQLGSAAGKAEILHLLDAEYLRQRTPNLRESERSQILLSGVNAAARLKLPEAKPNLERLASHSSDSMLRSAARIALSR